MAKHPANSFFNAIEPNLFSEERISFIELAKREKVHVVTVWRWSLRGCKGHRLESMVVGGRRYTTLPAYERWLARINDQTPRPNLGRTPRQREADIRRAEKELDELGI